MKKLSLILALIFVFSCSVLAACGGEEESSAPAESSKAAVSSQAPVSSEAEEESSEAEEESSEPEEESSEPEEVESVNLVAGMIATAVEGSSESDLALLTDGVKGTQFWEDEPDLYCTVISNIDGTDWAGWAEFFGFVEYDLGAPTAITAVNVVANGAPWDVLVLTSEDGTTWTKQAAVGSLQQNCMTTDGTEIITVNMPISVTAQYVRVGFGASEGYSSAASEIEILGVAE